jgi:hypothetical protein
VILRICQQERTWPLGQTLGRPVGVARGALSDMWINRDPRAT